MDRYSDLLWLELKLVNRGGGYEQDVLNESYNKLDWFMDYLCAERGLLQRPYVRDDLRSDYISYVSIIQRLFVRIGGELVHTLVNIRAVHMSRGIPDVVDWVNQTMVYLFDKKDEANRFEST